MKQALDLDIVVISWLPKLYSNLRFSEEAIKNNLSLKVLNIDEITEAHANKYPAIPHLLRIGDYKYKESILHLKKFNLRYINNLNSFIACRNKFITYKTWDHTDIPFPTSCLIQFSEGKVYDTKENQLFSFKKNDWKFLYENIINLFKNQSKSTVSFVTKVPIAMKGHGVRLIQSSKDLEQAAESSDNLIAQFHHTECFGKDIRVFMIKDKMFAIERTNTTDFRSNLALGGKASYCELNSEEIIFCKKIFNNSELHYAGIDFLRTNTGPKFLEINVSPGFEGIEKVYNTNIAGLIFSF
jgi:RimK family alpha-L-glutamate ligase